MDRRRSILWCNDHLSKGFINTQYLYKQSKGNLDFIQRLGVDRKLDGHNGCVNTICWNDVGNLLLSGSDDQHLIVTNPFTKKIAASIHSGHRANIFSAKFLPNTRDNHLISCSGDGILCFTNVEREDSYSNHTFDCHLGTAYEVMTVPNDSHTFLSCGEDGTVRWFDLRIKDKCNKSDCREDVMINCRRAVTALGINPLVPYQLAVGCSDSSVRMFDRRMLGTKSTGNYTGRGITGMYSRFTAPSLEGKSHRITSLEFSHDGHEVLVSYSSEYIYLFNMKEDARLQKFSTKEPVAAPNTEDVEAMEKTNPAVSDDVMSNEEAKTDSNPSPSGAEGTSTSERQPPIKRLRLRGDWSDTGPQARPETGDRPNTSLMQRMSDMLTRWFDDNTRRQSGSREAEGSPSDNPAEGGSEQQVTGTEESGSNETEQMDAAATPSAGTSNSTEADSPAASSLPCLRLPVPQGIPESSSSSDSLSSPSTVIAITPCIEKRLVTVDEDIAEEQSQQESSTSDNTESTVVDTVSENLTSDSGSAELRDQSVVIKEAPPGDETNGTCTTHEHETSCADLNKQLASSSSCEETTGSSTLEVIETVNKEVTSIRDRIITTDIEPVISLEYNSEGTTASTIKVGFTPSEGVIDIDSEAMQPLSNSRSTVSPTDPLHGANNDVSQSTAVSSDSMDIEFASDSPQVPPRIPTDSISIDTSQGFDQDSNTENEALKSGETERGALASSSPPVKEFGALSTMPDDKNSQSQDLTVAADTLKCDDSSHDFDDTSNDRSESFASSPGGNIAERSQGSSGRSSDASPMEQGSEATTSEYLSAMDTDGSREPSIGGDPPAVGEGTSDGIDTVDKIQGGVIGDETFGCDKSGETGDTETERAAAENQAATRPTELEEEDEHQTPGPSGSQSARQRRIGHSGPPTGNFQLFSPTDRRGEDSDDESEDDDIGIHRIRREGSRWATANAVAKRLQRMYRKRQEEREREEEAMRNVHEPAVKMVYKGHRNARTMIKEANFWGDQYVMSGSDCGHIFVWDRYTAKLVMLLEADKHVVNCLQPHPYYPVLASSGIDYDVKIWSPIQREVGFDIPAAEEVVKRNEVMLEETRDTITVPASFMLRMLASLNNIRTGRREERQNEDSSSGED